MITPSDTLSFSQDYSLIAPVNVDLTIPRYEHAKMTFGFDPQYNNGETSYGHFRFKIELPLGRTMQQTMVPIDLQLWGVHLEGRKVVCAVSKRPDPEFKPKNPRNIAWPEGESHYLYRIEAINVACFSHRPDPNVTSADCEMLDRIIRLMIPAYDRRDRVIAQRNSSKSTVRVAGSLQSPDRAILNFLNRTTLVSSNDDEAKKQVPGIDEFFGHGWRDRFDHGFGNTEGIKVSGARSEILPAIKVSVGGADYYFTYEFTSDSANDYKVPVAVLYTPKFANAIDAFMVGNAADLEWNFAKAKSVAAKAVYKILNSRVRRRHRDAVLNVVTMEGAL
ncbi:hypothetical protein RJJ37_19715 [Rhizobium redzepovicii]|uniref:Uncharacterized protein n=1 Tax=Rhizobium redzepovicii TaxID=2867518 RepID=A0AAW8P8X4_9HYPH|nr:hypothetical protein [Rhizobium redzepovicii]MDR9761833.1 hypothetical protein [Rhizobium redzepovicii]